MPIASKTVEQMLDPKNIAEKAAIMEKAQMKPEDYLGGRTEEQVQADLVEMFDKFDADNSGELDAEEFEACMKSMELGLSKGQIGALMATADTSGDGTIDKVSRARARERESARARGALAALFLPPPPAGMTLRRGLLPGQPLNPAAAAAAPSPTFNDKVEFMAFAFKHLMYLVKLVCARRGS